ncbi:MAG: hypothetical protein RRA92_02215 [Gemmatimonadota bacterium]|nr:hypothetical protein [Gemmatimonadota bacterium]
MERRETWAGRSGNILTALLLALALGLLARDRLLPALAEWRAVDPGEGIPADLKAVREATGDTVALRALAPATILAVLPTCPACERSAPAWRTAARAGGGRLHVLVLGGAPGSWAADHLPEASVLTPLDEPALLERLRIRVVPTALVLAADGSLRARDEGVLPDERIAALLAPDGAPSPP